MTHDTSHTTTTCYGVPAPTARHSTIALFTALTLAATVLGWTHPPSSWPNNIDPGVFMTRATIMADTGSLITHGQVSPPLRYIPLAVLYWFTDPSPALAGRIAGLHAAIFSFVILPAAIHVFTRTVYNARVADVTILGFIGLRAIGFQGFGYYLGSWQYDIFAPFVFLALAATHNAITAPGQLTRKQYSLAAGICIGILGLGEFALTAISIIIVTLAYLNSREFSLLAITGAVGALFTPALFLLPSKANNHVSVYLDKRIIPDGLSKWALPGMMNTPRDMAVFTALVLLGATAVVTAVWLSDSRIVEFSLGVYTFFWFTGNLTATWYHLGIVQKVGPFILLAASVAVVGRITKPRRLPRPPTRYHEITAWCGLMLALALLLVNTATGHIGTNPMSGSLF